MDSKVIPDAILEAFICKKCYKYLTVGPIGVHLDGETVCGRCYKEKHSNKPLVILDYLREDDGGIPFALLAYLTYSKCLYPCINRYDGCTELVPFWKVQFHEEECEFEERRTCPLCSFSGNGLQLTEHFKVSHVGCLLTDTTGFSVYVNRDSSSTYLYKHCKLLFFVTVQFIKDLNLLKTKTAYLGTTSSSSFRIQLELKYRNKSEERRFILETCPVFLVKDQPVHANFRVNNIHFDDTDRLVCKYNVFMM